MRYQVVDPASGEKTWVEFTGPELLVEGGGRQILIAQAENGELRVHTKIIPVPHNKFSTIPPTELKNLIESHCSAAEEDFTPGDTLSLAALFGEGSTQLAADLSQVEFDGENFITEGDQPDDALIGYQRLPNGVSFLGCLAGGDWETLLFLAIYFDGKELRAYIPEAGNPYNTDLNCAYGNNDDLDVANAKKRFPAVFQNVQASDADGQMQHLAGDEELIMADLTARFKP
ncbi:MAG: hypothetical protein K1X83_02370 [Oligoflexia bacterium]|nr:hypothetical protein [Oligoflexia bacterium]